MNRCLDDLFRHIRFASTSALPLCLFLSSCGGDGTSVASLPPPPLTPTPTPTPTPKPQFDVKTSWLDSPATRAGSYDLIGRLSLAPGNGGATTSRIAPPGEFMMSTDWYFGRESGDLPNYTIHGPSGILPAGLTSISVVGPFLSWAFNPPHSFADEPLGSYCCQMLGQHLTAYSIAADGSETEILSNDLTRGVTNQQPIGTNNNVTVTLDYDIGFSYVAMGEWSWHAVDLSGAATSGNLLFVNGERTPAAGIPASGTATYDAHTFALLSSNLTLGIPFTLTADFGLRTISTHIDQDYHYIPYNADLLDDPAPAIHVSGTGPFSNSGSFNIPLTGTASEHGYNVPTPPPLDPVTGSLNGAFFGPNAEQVGGTFSLQRSGDQVSLYQDAFVGQQHH